MVIRPLFLPTVALLLSAAYAGKDSCWAAGSKIGTWAFLPCERWVHNADPVARVFDRRLYVYTSWDHKYDCGKRWNKPWLRKQGLNRFCMPGYRAYSTADPTLRSGWEAHGAILKEEQVPWLWSGDEGFRGSARMWAPDVVRGDDERYYMFFPAPLSMHDMRVGVAVAKNPEGPFWPRKKKPIANLHGIDPSVVRLPSDKWAAFTSLNGRIYVQTLNSVFTWASPRKPVRGLKPGYKEGPHAEIRDGRLLLFYSLSTPKIGYTIEQAVAYKIKRPDRGFTHANTETAAITAFDGRTNHAFTVSFEGRDWIFYHRHMEKHGSKWSTRKVVFSPVQYRNGFMKTIRPSLLNGFRVKL